MKMRILWITMAAMMALSVAPAIARAGPPAMESGFHALYDTRFHEAREQFQAWESANPDDPTGPAFEAASYLFEEFYRQGVFTSKFFLDDDRLLEGISGKPDEARRARFLAAIAKAQSLAERRMAKNPKDAEALFALTITTGMMADYETLLDKNQWESLKFVRKSENYAGRLLAVSPDSGDAYLALGAANYIIGSLPFHKRAFLWLDGIRGNRQLGLAQLSMAAEHGNYLRPFAKILLALIELRERQPAKAREQLAELAAEFPQNSSFARELAMLDHPAH
ncbi:MAG: hypothetical protein ACM3NO_00060 [Deltaproteobacteria bacterium]